MTLADSAEGPENCGANCGVTIKGLVHVNHVTSVSPSSASSGREPTNIAHEAREIVREALGPGMGTQQLPRHGNNSRLLSSHAAKDR